MLRNGNSALDPSVDSLKFLPCWAQTKIKNKVCNNTAIMLDFCLQYLISFYSKSTQTSGRTFFGLELKLKNELQRPSRTI